MNSAKTPAGPGEYVVTQMDGNQELVLQGPGINVSIREAFPELSEHSLKMLSRALSECYSAGKRAKMAQIKQALEIL